MRRIAAAWLALSLAWVTPAAAQLQTENLPKEIIIEGSNSCLTSADRGPIFTPCNNSAEQKWLMIKRSNYETGFDIAQSGSPFCVAIVDDRRLEMRECGERLPTMQWAKLPGRQMVSVASQSDPKTGEERPGMCLSASENRSIELVPCADREATLFSSRLADREALPAVLDVKGRRFKLGEIRNGNNCLTRIVDDRTAKEGVRFEACYSAAGDRDRFNQLWAYSLSGTMIEDTSEGAARIINAKSGGCLALEGPGFAIQRCDDANRVTQVFSAFFRNIQQDVGNGRDTYCLNVREDGALAYGIASRGQCRPEDIWNKENFTFTSTGLPFRDWTPPPVPVPPLGKTKSIQWVRVTCKKPATGVADEVYDALAVAEWVMVVKTGPKEVAKTLAQDIVMSELGISIDDPSSPGFILNRLDQAFSSEDDLYLKINNSVIWPEYFDDPRDQVKLGYTPHGTLGGDESVNLFTQQNYNYRIDLLPGESATFSAWDWDSGSGNDLLAQVSLSYDLPLGPHKFLLLNKTEHSVYEFEFNVSEEPYWSCEGNLRKCVTHGPPMPRWP